MTVQQLHAGTGGATPADAAHARRFLRRMTVATGGGMFIDGFVFASISAALAGSGWSLLILGAVSLVGGLTSIAWAPETNGQDLSISGHRTPGMPDAAPAAA